MYRIDDNTASPTLPALPTDNIGTPGYFTGGNPATTTPATRVRFWWLNQVQEELCDVVTSAGIALVKGTLQLTAAIRALIVQSFSWNYTGGSAVVGTSGFSYWRISPDGFVEQGGYVNSPGAEDVAVTFPIPFPSGQAPIVNVTLANNVTTPNGFGVFDTSYTGFAMSQTAELSFYWEARWH